MGESADSGGGGNDEPRGTVFGVDGVSKTGSTAQDKAIGFTDGQGGKGANFDALQNATRSETSAAVAAANAARAAGGNEAAQQSAVANIFAPAAGSTLAQVDAVTAATDRRLIDLARAQAAENFKRQEVAAGMPTPVIDLPPDPEAAALRSRVPDPTAPLTVAEESNLVNMFSEAGLDPAAGQEAERQRQAQRQLAFETIVRNLGITTLPEAATAAAVLRTENAPDFDMDDREGDYLLNPSLRPAPMTLPVQSNQPPTGTARIIRQKGPGGDTSSQQLFETLDPATQALIEGTGTTAPASDFLARNPQPDAGGNLVNPLLSDGVSRETMQPVDPAQVGGVSVPTSPPDRFKTNAQREFFDNLASLPGGQAQFDAELRSLADRGFIGPRIAKVISEGGVPNYDPTAPEGYRIRGATATNFMGTMPISTYTGLDDPNAPVEVRDEQPAKAPNDPCPAGYQLIGGVCQPVDDVTQSAAPSSPRSDFQMDPTTGLPTVFQPTTVATPVDPISPFVLRQEPLLTIDPLPSPQGIQALSPTGAALGRQV